MKKLKLLLIASLIGNIGISQTFIQGNFVPPTCFGMCDGSVMFSTTVTPGPFTAVLTNSSSCPNTTVQSSTGNSITITNLCACSSDYSVSIYNSSSILVGFELLQVPVTTTAQLTLMTPTINPAVCSTCCNGSLYIGWAGGFAPTVNDATITIDGVNVGNSYFPNPTLCVGQHTVCVTDLANCNVCTTFSMNFVPVAGLNENSNLSRIIISPNPSFDEILISTSTNEIIHSLKLFDLTGKIVLELNNIDGFQNNLTIDIAALKPGIYFIELAGGVNKQVARQKLIKIER